jgi:hypothetical protein
VFKPIDAAREAGKFKSLDQLARRLVTEFPEPGWPEPRALAVKLGDIDRNNRIWWTKRDAHALALATMLEMPLADLGLHDAPAGDVFEFATFPELPPIVLARETPCEIGFVYNKGKERSDEDLAFWLSASPPRHAWRGPEHRISWLQFRPGAGLSLFRAALGAGTRHDHMSTRRLLDATERLRQSGNLILHVDLPCEDADMIALGRAHPDLNILILAPFAAPTLGEDAPTSWLPAWDVLTGAVDQRMAMLKDPRDIFDGMARYEWRLHEDWQDRLLAWVEKRIAHATSDTLFTSDRVRDWLADFPSGWQFVEGPADLLALCRLCHLSPKSALPKVSDLDAGQRLLRHVAGADNALSRRFTSLVTARLEGRDLPWLGELARTQWAALGPSLTSFPDEATLLEIANATNIAARRRRATALSEQLRNKGLAPLIEARLLVETQNDTLALMPQFLVDLVARDRLMQVIRDEPVEHWAMYCFDMQRRPLVDAALGSMAATELLVVLDRIKALPSEHIAAIAGSEALFREIGKSVCGEKMVPAAFECLADMALPRLLTEGWTPQQWTRPEDDPEENLEWMAICWAWSLWRAAPPVEIPVGWAWHFPGWATELAAVETPYLWLPELPDQAVLPHKWQRMTALATRLAQRIARPPEIPPDFFKPMLLIEALRGRWRVDCAWLGNVIGHAGAPPVAAVAGLVLVQLKEIGSTAAARLLPALMEFVVSKWSDGITVTYFYRSRIRTWVLQNISLDDATSCLTERQLEALWQGPHTLPPHLLVGMLQNPDGLTSARASVRIEAVRLLGAEHVELLSRLLATETLGSFAAERLWKVAPAAAERFLDAVSADQPLASRRLLIQTAPKDRTGAAARAVLACVDVLPEDHRMEWARLRLPAAGVHAELLGQILGLDVGTEL